MNGLPDLLRNITAGADVLWSAATSRCEEGEVACRPGCIGCCTGLFAIGGAEGLLVRSAVDALLPRERESVRAAAEEISRATAVFFPGDPAAGTVDPARASRMSRFVQATHAIPCPLLGVDGRCRTYASRPLQCRTSGVALVSGVVVESPACALNFPEARPARSVENGIPLEALRSIERQLEAAVVAAGWNPPAETTIPHAIVGSAFEGGAARR